MAPNMVLFIRAGRTQGPFAKVSLMPQMSIDPALPCKVANRGLRCLASHAVLLISKVELHSLGLSPNATGDSIHELLLSLLGQALSPLL